MTPAKLAEAYERALALQAAGDADGADRLLKRILLTRPGHAGAVLQRGAIALEAGETERALGLIRKAAGIAAHDAALQSEAGNLLLAAGEGAEALEAFRRAVEAAPGEGAYWNDLGNGFSALGRWREALEGYEAALARNPALTVVASNRGNALLRLGREAEALAVQDEAVAAEPQNPRFRANRAAALAALGRREEALQEIDAGLALVPSDPSLTWNRGLLRLQLGRLEAGFADYEARKRKVPPLGLAYPDAPEWTGREPVAGRTLLLHWEQGFGDTIQMSRYARVAVERGARVVLQVQDALVGLLGSLGADVTVIGQDEAPPPFDLHAPLMSLPHVFGAQIEAIPASGGYLASDRERAQTWAKRLGPSGGRPRLGLVWRGAVGHENDLKRSLPAEVLAELLRMDADWVSLQQGLSDADAAQLAEAGARSVGDEFADFADAAAAMAAFDGVVTVDTSVAHLAGALGNPVWILLPFDPDWRWLLDRSDSPWYASARLFRQPGPGDWAAVLADVRRALAETPPRG